jgi:peptide/nickel transport system permease protein
MKFFRDLPTLISSLILITLYTLLIITDFIAPYDPYFQNPEAGYAPPSKIHLDGQGFYIYKQKYSFDSKSLAKQSLEDKESGKFRINFFKNKKFFSVDEPAYLYLLGTDQLGRDLFSRILYGSRPSLLIGFLGLLIAFPLGAIYGAISGYFGARVDNLMMRIAEAVMSLPSFYLLIILSALLPTKLSNSHRFALITLILSFISWASLSRIIRGLVLSIKSRDYILAAKNMGEKDFQIVIKHLIPQSFSFLLVAATLSIPGFIIGESALSFLGLGINQPDPSWGNILSEAKSLSNILTRPWLIWTPSLLIFSVVFSFNTLGDRLRDFFDPKSQL